MRINPINNNSYNTNFQSKIKMNKFFQEGLASAKSSIGRSEYKSLNEAKKFYDSMRKIVNDTKVKEIFFDIDKKACEAYAVADGNLAATFPYQPNYCEGYISTQIIKKYAESIDKEFAPTLLDSYKMNYEIKRNDLYEARRVYQTQIETELDELIKDATV